MTANRRRYSNYFAGNLTREQKADGEHTVYTYSYNRLTATNCQQGNVGYTEQRTYLDDGRIATYDLNGTRQGYSYNITQPHTLRNIHTLPNRASDVLFSFAWDAKGNMTGQNSQGGSRRNLVWDERNRMLGMVDNAASGNAAHYVYDAQGERTFKLTGYSNHTGSGETSETYVSLDESTLYASPYLTATASGYTKHYFAGTERLASAIGNGGLADIGIVGSEGLIDKRMERDTLLHRVMEPYPLRINRNRLDTLYAMTQPDTTAELTYFFHPDHLGSASWITDLSGQPVQHLQYKPFGGDYIDQQDPNTEYSERFHFTGKERDAETGFDYFGARYYSSSLGIWLSVDPMSDKYPSLSPYVYCADNPMRLVDVEGSHIEVVENDNGTYTVVNGSINKDKNIYIIDNEGKRTGETLGKMLTNYSFFYDEGIVAKGAIINPDDNRGKDFLSNMVDNPINLLEYIFDKEKGGRDCGDMDFKRNLVPEELKGDDEKSRIYYYQGMPLSDAPGISDKNVYGTARDVGNYTAGYMAGSNGLS